MELDPNRSNGWAALADIKCSLWDWAGSEQDYRRALTLNPNNSDAHERLGWILDTFGRLDEGWKESEIAQQVDPIREHLSQALHARHEYDQMIQNATRMLEADPEYGNP